MPRQIASVSTDGHDAMCSCVGWLVDSVVILVFTRYRTRSEIGYRSDIGVE